MPSVVPASTVNETLSTARTYAFEYSPVRTVNRLLQPVHAQQYAIPCVRVSGVSPAGGAQSCQAVSRRWGLRCDRWA